MSQQSATAREALLDAAEQLFATEGFDAVSSRRIAEQAGHANHSAVAYHFGSREELLRALLIRGDERMTVRRAELVAQLSPDSSFRDVVATQILPWIELLDSLPQPSWRARMLFHVRSVPSATAVLTEVAQAHVANEYRLIVRHADIIGIPAVVLDARSRLLGPTVLGVCADYESQVAAGNAQGAWLQVGTFLIDVAAGMLAAPSSLETSPLAVTPSLDVV